MRIAPAQSEFGTVRAPRGVGTVTLLSPGQTLQLDVSSGSARAIAGSYKLTSIKLTQTDAQNQAWTAIGSLADKTVEVDVAQGSTVELPEMLPLTVSIEPTGTAPFEEVSLSARIVSPSGATFRTPRSVGQPEGGFEVLDATGRVVGSGSFEYG